MKKKGTLLFAVLSFFGCNNLDTGNVETKQPVGITIDGKKEGKWETYYTNGQVAKVEHYHNDTLNGQLLYFDDKGRLKGKGFYKMGIKVDSSQLYFPNGKANLEEWKDSSGKTQGLFKVYHQNGQLSQIGYMKDDYLDDTCKTFFENGQLKNIEIYKDKNKEGEWQYFSEKGNLIRTELYKKGVLISSKK